MNRQDKEQLVTSLRERFSACQAAFVVEVQGLTVGQLQALRRGVRACDGHVQVAKNTLLSRATDGLGAVHDLNPQFARQIAVVFATGDAPAVARAIFSAKQNANKLKVTAGYFDGALISAQKVQFLASLPSREQLLGQLCGVLSAPVVKLLWVLKAASEKGQ
ncbi:MAG: 50S ribosomal protein L10 [Candidatus Dependentiae bacterium]|nr:50S ribosomal protein L10 [Candidatus Dependentiae bacterium]